MKRRIKGLSIIVAVCLLTGCSAGERPEELTEDVNTRVMIDYSIDSYAPVQDFSYELFSRNLDGSNPVLSPVSAYLAMGMAGLGARGETSEEFRTVLGGDLQCIPDDIMNRFPQKEEGMEVSIASSAWISEELEVKDPWLTKLTSLYDAQVYKGELASQETKDSINQWVGEQTRQLIPSLLTEPLPADTRLALLNTVYFNGEWEYPFDSFATAKKEFTTSGGETVTVDMMQEYSCHRDYVKNEEMEGIVLPYRNSDLAFVALKPAAGQSVREMYQQTGIEDIQKLLQDREDRLVNLQLPRFEITFDRELNESLQNMGLRLAFDRDAADLADIGTLSNGAKLYISLVRQKAVIRVDEEGTEAAAVTEVLVGETSARKEEPPLDVFFHEPFLYMIMDMETGVPLFMGILDDPSAE